MVRDGISYNKVPSQNDVEESKFVLYWDQPFLVDWIGRVSSCSIGGKPFSVSLVEQPHQSKPVAVETVDSNRTRPKQQLAVHNNSRICFLFCFVPNSAIRSFVCFSPDVLCQCVTCRMLDCTAPLTCHMITSKRCIYAFETES